MPGENPFEKELQASKNKHAAAVGGLLILTSLAAAGGKWWTKKNKLRKIEKANADLSVCVQAINASSKYFDELFYADYFVLDSNVWMDPDADPLFDLLQDEATRRNGQICCLESQMKEIDNLKKPPRNSHRKYNDGPHGRARHAQNRMDKFKKAGLLRYVNDTAVAAGRTHADAIFIDYFLSGVAPSATIRFVSDDTGLRLLLMKVEAAKPGLYKTIDRVELLDRARGLTLLYRKRAMLERGLKLLGSE